MDNNMMDAKTLAYINLYAVLGSLKYLCELSPEAKKLAGCRPVSIGFDVHGGPAATLTVGEGCCTLTEGVGSCDIKLPFRSAEKFNGMIAGTVTPIPTKGLTKVGFLTGRFTKLTNLLTRYLKPTPEDLKNEHFFHVSTVLMFRLIVAAAAQIGNHDKVGRFCAKYIVDGNIRVAIAGGPVAYLAARGGHLTAVQTEPETMLSSMEFGSIPVARALFEGTESSFELICAGQVRMTGMLLQLDNLNRILDRVGLYLA